MDSGALRKAVIGAMFSAGLALGGCASSGFTVHSIIDQPGTPATASTLQGLWVPEDTDPEDYWVLRVAPLSVLYRAGARACEVAEIRVWQEPTPLADPPLLEGRACLTEVAGQMVVEISTLSEPTLYLHYLVRLEPTQISVCGGVSVWHIFWRLADDKPSLVTLEGLEYTARAWNEFHQIFVISDRAKLRAFLEKQLPRLAEICDAGDEASWKWMAFRRVTPEPSPTPDEAGEESGDEYPAAPQQP